jgi:hypothetical protein
MRAFRYVLFLALVTVFLILPPRSHADVVDLNPTDDAVIMMRSPDTNYGASVEMVVENRYGHPAHPPNWEKDALSQFDLSSIPDHSVIILARLHLYYYLWHDNDPVGRNLTCHSVTGSWIEETVTWNSRPTWSSQVTSSAVVPNSFGWMDWDVTSDVQSVVNQELPNHGWVIMDEVPWNDFDIPWTQFYAKENGFLVPYLEVIFAPPPTPVGVNSWGRIKELFR